MNELVICYITGKENNLWFRMSLESSLAVADKIIIVAGEGDQETLDLINEIGRYTNQLHKIKIINKRFDRAYKGANGKQRNIYLNEVEEGDWILRLDPDEVLSDNAFILKDLMKEKLNAYNIRMIHFIYNLGLEDATQPIHRVPFTLFKKTKGLKYQETEHPLLEGVCGDVGLFDEVIIYHFAYVKGIESTLNKFKTHWEKSEMHSKEYLIAWKNGHLFGGYPVKPFTKFNELPYVVRREFGI